MENHDVLLDWKLRILAGPNNKLKGPYDHLVWDIIIAYSHRMPKIKKILRSHTFLSAASTHRASCIRHPQNGDLYFHRRLIERFSPEGRDYLKFLDENKIEPFRKKRKTPPTPITLKTIQSDYEYLKKWLKGNVYKMAKLAAQQGGLKGGDVDNVKKRKHASAMDKVKRIIRAIDISIRMDYEPPKGPAHKNLLRLPEQERSEKTLLDYAYMLHRERLKMSHNRYMRKFSQTRPKNIFEEYLNSRLRHAYYLFQAPPKSVKKP